jgi:tetratricopeptide (TPR) repeat protein
MVRSALLSFVIAIACVANYVYAQDISLLPKYGSLQKTEKQLTTDQKFIAEIDTLYQGNRTKAAADASNRGWQLLRQGNFNDAMRRFNQAWLLDSSNGHALWGMAAVLGGTGKLDEAVKFFIEAERSIGNDIDFAADYARAVGILGAQRKNEALLNDAFARFAQVHEKSPQHVLNLQNWAITLFYVGKYAEAWDKVKLAQAAPRRAELDRDFIAALQSKMPQP